MPKARKTAGVQTVNTTYRDFSSREHLTSFVNDSVQGALAKFLTRHNTRIAVTLDKGENRTRRKLFNVGITLKPAHQAPIHIEREASELHAAIRAAVNAVQKILRREHARMIAARRHRRSNFAMS